MKEELWKKCTTEEDLDEQYKVLIAIPDTNQEQVAKMLARFTEARIFSQADVVIELKNKRIEGLEESYAEFTHDMAFMRREVLEAHRLLERASTQTEWDAWGCPLCIYKEGVLVKTCSLHGRIDVLEEKLAEAREWVKE